MNFETLINLIFVTLQTALMKNIASPPDFKKIKSPTSPKNAQLNPIRLERPKSFSNELNNEMGVKQKKMKKIIKKFF